MSTVTPLVATMGTSTCGQDADTCVVMVGTYTGGASEGIYRFRFDATDGVMSAPELASVSSNPSYLAVDERRSLLFAVNESEVFSGERQGSVSSFEIVASSGELRPVSKTGTLGAHPCYISLAPSTRHILVANYTGGSVSVFPVWSAGRLGPATSFMQHKGSSVNPRRQSGPHAHAVIPSPGGRFVLVTDLGLDQVLIYRFDHETGVLTPGPTPHVALSPGVGPRHLEFHPDGRWFYVANELDSSVSVFEWDEESGRATAGDTVSMLPEGFSGRNSAADIHVHPGGKTLYASNRGHDSIAVFDVATDGGLTLVENVSIEGRTPRNFVLLPGGEWLLAAGRQSNTVTSFAVDPGSGVPVYTGHKIEVPAPVCLLPV